MIERMIVPHAPADKPGNDGKKSSGNTEPKQRGFLGRMVKGVTKEGRKVLRQERNAEQRAKENREHLREPEVLRKRLKEFDAELYYFKSFDRPVAALAALLYTKARKLRLPPTGERRVQFEASLAEEARRYIFSGIIPRGDERISDEDQKKGTKHVEHLRKINDKAVARHLRTYLVWRWAEAEWQKDWNEWQKRYREKKTIPEAETPDSFPKWHENLNGWIRARKEHKLTVTENGPLRPPAPSEQSLVISLAKRLGENHLEWKVDPIKPEIA